MVDRDGGPGAQSGHVLTKACRKSWPSVTPPTMTSTSAVVAAAGCRMRPPRPTPMTAIRLTARATEHHRLEDAGVSEGHFEMLAGEDPLADFES